MGNNLLSPGNSDYVITKIFRNMLRCFFSRKLLSSRLWTLQSIAGCGGRVYSSSQNKSIITKQLYLFIIWILLFIVSPFIPYIYCSVFTFIYFLLLLFFYILMVTSFLSYIYCSFFLLFIFLITSFIPSFFLNYFEISRPNPKQFSLTIASKFHSNFKTYFISFKPD